MPMLPSDTRSKWERSLLADDRVTHFWDEDLRLGEWLADPDNLRLGYSGSVLWDAYLLFGRRARWDEKPTNLVGAGWTVIGRTADLEKELALVLETT